MNYIEKIDELHRLNIQGFEVIVNYADTIKKHIEEEQYEEACSLLTRLARMVRVHIQDTKIQLRDKSHGGLPDFQKLTIEVMENMGLLEKFQKAFELTYAKGYNAGAEAVKKRMEEMKKEIEKVAKD